MNLKQILYGLVASTILASIPMPSHATPTGFHMAMASQLAAPAQVATAARVASPLWIDYCTRIFGNSRLSVAAIVISGLAGGLVTCNYTSIRVCIRDCIRDHIYNTPAADLFAARTGVTQEYGLPAAPEDAQEVARPVAPDTLPATRTRTNYQRELYTSLVSARDAICAQFATQSLAVRSFVARSFAVPEVATQSVEAQQCTICLGDLIPSPAPLRLPCNHAFHAQCIGGWFTTDNHRTCPMCRAEVQ